MLSVCCAARIFGCLGRFLVGTQLQNADWSIKIGLQRRLILFEDLFANRESVLIEDLFLYSSPQQPSPALFSLRVETEYYSLRFQEPTRVLQRDCGHRGQGVLAIRREGRRGLALVVLFQSDIAGYPICLRTWVGLTLIWDVPPSCPVAQPILHNSQLPS